MSMKGWRKNWIMVITITILLHVYIWRRIYIFPHVNTLIQAKPADRCCWDRQTQKYRNRLVFFYLFLLARRRSAKIGIDFTVFIPPRDAQKKTYILRTSSFASHMVDGKINFMMPRKRIKLFNWDEDNLSLVVLFRFLRHLKIWRIVIKSWDKNEKWRKAL